MCVTRGCREKIKCDILSFLYIFYRNVSRHLPDCQHYIILSNEKKRANFCTHDRFPIKFNLLILQSAIISVIKLDKVVLHFLKQQSN